jgi:tetratricopeptide (TPR) repeat protein
MARTLVKQSPSAAQKSPALVLSLWAPLCTRKHFGGSLSRPITLSSKCLYHTSARIKYADIVHDENRSESKESVGSSAVQQQLDRAYSLVSVVERDGEHAQEYARDAVEIFARILAHEQLSKDEQASCRDGMGVCYTKLGDIAAAERVLQQGVEAHPTFAPLWLHLGEVMQQYGQHLEAVMMFTKFVELSKEFYHTTHTQYEDGAVAYHYTTRARYTDNVQLLCAAFFKRAVSYIRVQEETMALTDLWLIVDTAHSPQWTARAYLAIAQLARLRGDWHQARNLATKSIEAAAQDPAQSRERAQVLSQAHHVRAVCYEALDDDARAEQDHVLADFYFRETAFKAAELSVNKC